MLGDAYPLFESESEQRGPLTVTQLTERIKFVLEEDFSAVSLIGEIASFKQHSSGHLYFELKDDTSRISAVMFRNNARSLNFEPCDGIKVVIEGAISVYGRQGRYQIVAERMTQMGLGELEVKFRRLREKLEKEGLFDAIHKKPIPFLPSGIGIATSISGAAVQDVLRILRARNSRVNIYVRPTIVQGEKAPQDIVAAITELDSHAGVDVIIVGRGGGSYEDLFVFNDEQVARAIFAARKPVISAVGHEIDFTISDFVADLRAATPTDAASKASADLREIILSLAEQNTRLDSVIQKDFREARRNIEQVKRNLYAVGPVQKLRNYQQSIDEIATRMIMSIKKILQESATGLDRKKDKLDALSPLCVLQRGYSIVRAKGRIIDSAAGVNVGDEVEVTLSKGKIGAQVLWSERNE